MTRRHPDVLVTTFHALDPRECGCREDACIAAAIERTTAIDAPGVARCEGPDETPAAAAPKAGGR